MKDKEANRPVACVLHGLLTRKEVASIVPRDSVNRKIVFLKVTAVTWLLWPAVCVRMMKVINIWNEWLSFFHFFPVEQTPPVTHPLMCLCVCVISIQEAGTCATVFAWYQFWRKTRGIQNRVMRPISFFFFSLPHRYSCTSIRNTKPVMQCSN